MGLPPIARSAVRPPVFQHQESGVDLALIARTKAKYGSFVDASPPKPGLAGTSSTSKVIKLPPQETRAERKLWWVAGGLIGMAFCVLGVLGFMTFAPQITAPAAIAAAAPEPIAAPSVAVPAPSPTGISRPAVTAVRAQRAEKRAEAPKKKHAKKARGRS